MGRVAVTKGYPVQTTLKSAITFQGFGLHSGKPACLTIRPAAADFGIWFQRTDLDTVSSKADTLIPARWDVVETSPLCTLLRNEAGASVSTVEHVMAALSGCGVHNALIEIDGPEVPILDGSSIPFVREILACGLQELDSPLKVIEVLAPVSVKTDQGWAQISPAQPGQGLQMDFHIDFVDRAIGQQDKTLNLANGTFVRELCDSRTFCRAADVEAMHAAGKALGGTYENAVVVDDDKVLSPGGLRHRDEAVRHKMLDALGDLALAGLPIVGHYEGHKAGHAMTNALLHELFATPSAFRIVTCDPFMAQNLPGAGVELDEIPVLN